MQIMILVVMLFLLLLFSSWFSKGDVLAPSVVFSASFLFAAIWLIPFKNIWRFELHWNTLTYILAGIIMFCVVCLLVSNSRVKLKSVYNFDEELKYIEITRWKKIVFAMVALFTVLYSFYIKLRFAGGGFSTLFTTMASYREDIMFHGGAMVSFPKWLNLLNSAVTSSGYWFSYVLANNFILKKQVDWYSLAIFLICLMNTVMSTSRGGTLTYLIAFLVYCVILLRIRNGRMLKIDFSILVKVGLILSVFIITFPTVGNLISRGSSETAADYLARYCGAPLANFDAWLQYPVVTNEILGSQTFIYVIQWFGGKLGFLDSIYGLDLPFRFVEGKNLGNVYTTFYPFVYDFGFLGLIALTGLMAFISQTVYLRAIKDGFDYRPSRFLLAYGFIMPTLLLSFFSNKFYESVFNSSFVYTFLFWIVFEYIFCAKSKKKLKFR